MRQLLVIATPHQVRDKLLQSLPRQTGRNDKFGDFREFVSVFDI